MANCKSTKTRGVRYREHETRKYGRQKDKYFYIRYIKNQKRCEEGLGWASEKWSEQRAGAVLFEIKENIRFGRLPQSFKEMRQMEQEKNTNQKQKEKSLGTGVLFKDIFEKYIKQVEIDTTRKTYQNRCDRYRIYIEPVIKNKTLAEVKKQDIEDIKTNMIKKKRADDTIKKTIAIVFQTYKFAIENELYDGAIPTVNVKVHCKDNKRTRYLTREEARKLLDEIWIHSQQVHDMACVALYAGLRAKEIRNLKWEHIIWNSNRLFAKWRKNGENSLIPIHPKLREILLKRFQCKDSEYVFTGKDGLAPKNISGTFRKCVKKLKLNEGVTDSLNKVVFHTLRHTYASWLVEKGVDLYTTQKLMGHKDIKMTQRYAHLAPGYLEKAVNSLESI